MLFLHSTLNHCVLPFKRKFFKRSRPSGGANSTCNDETFASHIFKSCHLRFCSYSNKSRHLQYFYHLCPRNCCIAHSAIGKMSFMSEGIVLLGIFYPHLHPAFRLFLGIGFSSTARFFTCLLLCIRLL